MKGVLVTRRFNSDWSKVASRVMDEMARANTRSSSFDVEKPSKNTIDITRWPPTKFNTILNVCPRGKHMVVERFGKLSAIRDAGLFFAIPFIDRINYVVDTREMTLVIDPQSGVTSDNVDVHVGGALFVVISDTEKACYKVRRPLFAVVQEAMSAMRTAIGKVTLDDLFHNRLALNDAVRNSMNHTAGDWGVIIKRYELREIIPDPTVKAAMDKQAVAERTRRETVLTAQADREAIITRSEGERQGDINRAEGEKARVELAATADAIKVKMEADAKAYAIRVVSEQLEQTNGRAALEFNLGSQYLQSLVSVLPNSKMNQ
jgi:regulator of protease activity HflC (stomatin/prohibitin superfamily)